MKSVCHTRAVLLALAGLACTATFAAPPEEPSKVVMIGDLNLGNPQGVATLYRRLQGAAAHVCQMPQGTKQLRLAVDIKACRADTINRAVSQVNLPALSAMHFARTGFQVDTQQYADRH